MSTARSRLGLAAVGGKIYAIDGSGGRSTLNSVEAYDPQLGAWALVASMSLKRSYHALVVLEGKVYAMGGHDDAGFLDTVEAYTTLRRTTGSGWRACRNAWSFTPPQRWVAISSPMAIRLSQHFFLIRPLF